MRRYFDLHFRATLKLEPLLNYLPTPAFDPTEQLSLSEASDNSTHTPELTSPSILNGVGGSSYPPTSPQETRQHIMERLKRLQEASASGQQPAPELSFAPSDENEYSNGSGNHGKPGVPVSPGLAGVSSGMEWIVKRMYAICAEISATYVQVG